MSRHRTQAPEIPVREPGAALNGHKAPWWHLRSKITDLATLARIRDGLKDLPDDDPEAEPAAPSPPPSLPADAGIAAIHESFAALAEAGDPAVNYFYSYLFTGQPRLRDLFPAAMDEQRDRLFRALSRIVNTLSTPEELAAYLAQLGRDHRKYDVQPEMYEAVGGALLRTLAKFAGAKFTPAAEEAWTQAYEAASAMMIRAAEEDHSPAYWTAQVTEHLYYGRGLAVITVAPDGVLPYVAGQHVTVQHPRWPRVWRPYSVACRPREDGQLVFHVRRIPGGWLSGALVSDTAPGDDLILGPALGGMTLAPAAGRDLLLVAGGTGLSCVKAIAEQAVRDIIAGGPRRRIDLYVGARTRPELYDLEDLHDLSGACEDLYLTPVTSEDRGFTGSQGHVGMVAARYMPPDCEAYVAGPEEMVRKTISALARRGLPAERIHYDDELLAARPRVGTGT